jgi:exopolyphosphatase/guanosine-5'-triphosphate,3'-diphosphate pyrophosphatase
MTRVAAVDIGTNSTRLLVADVEGEGADAVVTQVEREMRITRLGAGVDAERTLRADAIERTVAVLREYGETIERLGATRVRAAATSASRDARNRDEFFDPATAALHGVRPELLSGEEEAALSFLGATAGLHEPTPYLVVDVGGGSTEFVVGNDKPEGLISINIGCVRLTEQFLQSDPPEPEELSNAVSAVRDHLADVGREVPGVAAAATLVGLAGTVTTLAAIELGLTTYDPKLVHHFRLSRQAAEDVFRTLATEPIAQRRHNPGLDPGRVDVIVGGAVIVVSILRHFGFPEMLVSETDILDGLARSLG